jgi:hypothetical protein
VAPIHFKARVFTLVFWRNRPQKLSQWRQLCYIYSFCQLDPLRWERYIVPKRVYPTSNQRFVTSQKNEDLKYTNEAWNFITVFKLVVRACNETKLMHYLSSLYWVTAPLHVSGLLVAHHQEVVMYICNNWYVVYVLVNCQRVGWHSDSWLRLKRV